MADQAWRRHHHPSEHSASYYLGDTRMRYTTHQNEELYDPGYDDGAGDDYYDDERYEENTAGGLEEMWDSVPPQLETLPEEAEEDILSSTRSSRAASPSTVATNSPPSHYSYTARSRAESSDLEDTMAILKVLRTNSGPGGARSSSTPDRHRPYDRYANRSPLHVHRGTQQQPPAMTIEGRKVRFASSAERASVYRSTDRQHPPSGSLRLLKNRTRSTLRRSSESPLSPVSSTTSSSHPVEPIASTSTSTSTLPNPLTQSSLPSTSATTTTTLSRDQKSTPAAATDQTSISSATVPVVPPLTITVTSPTAAAVSDPAISARSLAQPSSSPSSNTTAVSDSTQTSAAATAAPVASSSTMAIAQSTALPPIAPLLTIPTPSAPVDPSPSPSSYAPSTARLSLASIGTNITQQTAASIAPLPSFSQPLHFPPGTPSPTSARSYHLLSTQQQQQRRVPGQSLELPHSVTDSKQPSIGHASSSQHPQAPGMSPTHSAATQSVSTDSHSFGATTAAGRQPMIAQYIQRFRTQPPLDADNRRRLANESNAPWWRLSAQQAIPSPTSSSTATPAVSALDPVTSKLQQRADEALQASLALESQPAPQPTLHHAAAASTEEAIHEQNMARLAQELKLPLPELGTAVNQAKSEPDELLRWRSARNAQQLGVAASSPVLSSSAASSVAVQASAAESDAEIVHRLKKRLGLSSAPLLPTFPSASVSSNPFEPVSSSVRPPSSAASSSFATSIPSPAAVCVPGSAPDSHPVLSPRAVQQQPQPPRGPSSPSPRVPSPAAAELPPLSPNSNRPSGSSAHIISSHEQPHSYPRRLSPMAARMPPPMPPSPAPSEPPQPPHSPPMSLSESKAAPTPRFVLSYYHTCPPTSSSPIQLPPFNPPAAPNRIESSPEYGRQETVYSTHAADPSPSLNSSPSVDNSQPRAVDSHEHSHHPTASHDTQAPIRTVEVSFPTQAVLSSTPDTIEPSHSREDAMRAAQAAFERSIAKLEQKFGQSMKDLQCQVSTANGIATLRFGYPIAPSSAPVALSVTPHEQPTVSPASTTTGPTPAASSSAPTVESQAAFSLYTPHTQSDPVLQALLQHMAALRAQIHHLESLG